MKHEILTDLNISGRTLFSLEEDKILNYVATIEIPNLDKQTY